MKPGNKYIRNLYRNAVIFTLIIVMFVIMLMAEINYIAAIQAAINCEGSDIAIEETMYEYGYSVDANSIIHPTAAEKVKALFNSNQYK